MELLFVMLILLAIIVGYILNIVKLAQAKKVDGLTILRVVGIVLPIIGIFLGFFDNTKEVV